MTGVKRIAEQMIPKHPSKSVGSDSAFFVSFK